MGAAIKQQGRAQEAITAMQMAAKLSPMDWEAFNNLGSTHRSLNNLAFARERFSDELMEELHKVAPSMIEEHGKALVISDKLAYQIYMRMYIGEGAPTELRNGLLGLTKG